MLRSAEPTWPCTQRVRTQEPLSKHTYLGIGGPAEYYTKVRGHNTFVAVLDYCRDQQLPMRVVGEGSNLLVSDTGVPGLVIHNASQEIHDLGCGMLQADSGVLMGQLAHWSANRGYRGLEFGVGIPGSVGGSIFGNAGCFGTEISQVLESADMWTSDGVESWPNQLFEFDYRSSKLHRIASTPIVLRAILRYRTGDPDAAKAEIRELSRRRRDAQPASRSAGSVFKNPRGEFAGNLIERAGLKGRNFGRAAISTQHANFIVNQGGASASDVWKLIVESRNAVRQRFGIDLELEVQLVGDGFDEAK